MEYRTCLILIVSVLFTSFSATATAQTTRIEENHPSITYSGNWRTIAHPSLSGGTIAMTNEAGAKATVSFTGTGVAWISSTCPCASAGIIRLDGVQKGLFDLYRATTIEQQDIFWIDGLAPGPHTLEIVAWGYHWSGSTDTYIGIDAIDYGDPIYDTYPTVSITSPAPEAYVTGTVTISAEAFDNDEISEVTFLARETVGGVAINLGTDTTPPYSITRDTSSIPHAKVYYLQAITYDRFGHGAHSADVPIRIVHNGNTDFTKPFVEMTAPADNTTVSGSVTMSAEGHDNVGITRVDFIITDGWSNTQWRISDTAAPFSITRDTSGLQSGRPFHITAEAFDAAGNTSMAPYPRRVTIQ